MSCGHFHSGRSALFSSVVFRQVLLFILLRAKGQGQLPVHRDPEQDRHQFPLLLRPGLRPGLLIAVCAAGAPEATADFPDGAIAHRKVRGLHPDQAL